MTTLETVLCLLAVTQTIGVAVHIWLGRKPTTPDPNPSQEAIMRLMVSISDHAISVSKQSLDLMKSKSEEVNPYLSISKEERQDLMRLVVQFSNQALAISEQNLDWIKYQQSGKDYGAPRVEHRQRPAEPDVTMNMEVDPIYRPGEPGPTG